MKAYKTAAGRVVLFRPEETQEECKEERQTQDAPCSRINFHRCSRTVCAAKFRWIPPMGKGAMYVRPLLNGSGPVLGVAPAPNTPS